jgi:hypothetical protein
MMEEQYEEPEEDSELHQFIRSEWDNIPIEQRDAIELNLASMYFFLSIDDMDRYDYDFKKLENTINKYIE